mmetsp:Transcript_9665/g.24157  ORF Transcript_9665/g.24157 Transcript_9665/m.24157 type:complete len:231 (-) Transcript_9665:56-748(-)
MSFWNRTSKLRTVFYERSFRFATGADAVVTKPYMMFLYVILLIWFAAMVQEFREILLWWLMMYKLPVDETEHCLISHEDHTVSVVAVPSLHKWITITLNLVPRSVICIGLLLTGVRFLIRAEDYADLILNSVALGFLIEVDNMLFAALASDTCKHLVRELRPYRMRTLGLGNWNLQTLFWTGGIIALALYFEAWSYFRPGGKEDMGVALTCLCQVSGIRCVGSQVLGGDM